MWWMGIEGIEAKKGGIGALSEDLDGYSSEFDGFIVL